MEIRKEDVLFLVLAIITILFFFWYAFGKSPTLEQGLLLALLTLVIKNNSDVAAIKERLKNHLKEHNS